jgi:hypothetical protein
VTVIELPQVVPAANAGSDEGVNARTRARARAREAPSVTGGPRKLLTTVANDARGSWVWTGSPPPLAAVVKYDAANVPGDHPLLRGANHAWKYTVAIPATAIAYTLAWLLQHPLRTLPALLAVGITLAIWLN